MKHGLFITIDVSKSTASIAELGHVQAAARKAAALKWAHDDLHRADPGLYRLWQSAGDSIFMVGGNPENVVEVFKAAIIYQAVWDAWKRNRMGVKIAIGIGDWPDETESKGFQNSTADTNFLARICDACPEGGIVVMPSVYGLLMEYNCHERLKEMREDLHGLGVSIYYMLNGDGTHHKNLEERRKGVRLTKASRLQDNDRLEHELTATAIWSNPITNQQLVQILLGSLGAGGLIALVYEVWFKTQ